MLFNSFDFGVFLVFVYLIYWAIGPNNRRLQNVFLLLASYFFYGFWDWRFLGLLVLSSVIDYVAGNLLQKEKLKGRRKIILWVSIAWNLGILFSFKYFNFFIESFESLFQIKHSSAYNFWNAAIPVGLSFYTFQTMSYTIDVYQKRIQPTKNILEFFCFVSFFPQLVAGPIEKAKKLLPQFEGKRQFDWNVSKNGLRQILWGLFKKIIVAEKLGLAVNMVFAAPDDFNFLTIAFAIILFCFQVYCDFSGYTDIAIGTAKLFGFRLSKNFRLPYLSKSISEFWQRWHITLTQWFTYYVYIPFVRLFKKKSLKTKAFALILTMTLVGFWHGTKWTFLLFGLFNGIIMVLERLPFGKNTKNLKGLLQKSPRVISLVYVFIVFTISGLFFRSQNMEQAFYMLKKLSSFSMNGAFTSLIGWKLGYLVLMVTAEMIFRRKDFPLQDIEEWLPKPVRWALYYLLIFIIIRYAEPKEAFIYFQF